MRVVRLSDAVCAQLAELAATAAPREFVALLGGRRVGGAASDSPDPPDSPDSPDSPHGPDGPRGPDGFDEATAVRTLTRQGGGRDSFVVDPIAFAQAEAELRDQGLEFVGFVHSHPGGVAAPSARDHLELWPGVVQLIVGCTTQGRHATIRAFRREGRDKLEPMAIATAATTATTTPKANP
ncbi:MAG: Mov34/MPN/PAD-1 family protein [Planctomycetota bacterium]